VANTLLYILVYFLSVQNSTLTSCISVTCKMFYYYYYYLYWFMKSISQKGRRLT